MWRCHDTSAETAGLLRSSEFPKFRKLTEYLRTHNVHHYIKKIMKVAKKDTENLAVSREKV